MDIQKMVKDALSSISNLFHGLQPKAKLAAHWGSAIVGCIHNFDVKNPGVADILTALIPGNIDDTIKTKLRGELPKLAVELRLVGDAIDKDDPEAVMLSLLTVFQSELSDRARNVFSHGLSVLLAEIVADGKISWSDGVLILEYYYRERIKTGSPVDEQALIAAA